MTGRRVSVLLIVAIAVIALGTWLSSRTTAPPESGAGEPVLKLLSAQLNEVTSLGLVEHP